MNIIYAINGGYIGSPSILSFRRVLRRSRKAAARCIAEQYARAHWYGCKAYIDGTLWDVTHRNGHTTWQRDYLRDHISPSIHRLACQY